MDSSNNIIYGASTGSIKYFSLLPADIHRFLIKYLRYPEKLHMMILNKKFHKLIKKKNKYINYYLHDVIRYDYLNLLRKINKNTIFIIKSI